MQTLVVCGGYGAFEGASYDQVVLGHYRTHGAWAPGLLRLLVDLTEGGSGTFLDVGANIGLVSIPLAQRTAVTGHCFEPSPHNFPCLERNLARHGMGGRFGCHRVALGARRGVAHLMLDGRNAGDHHLVPAEGRPEPRGRDTSDCVLVPSERLDALVDVGSLVGPVLMKVDTQGAEVDVLRGAGRVLDHVDHLVVEYWPLGLSRLGRRPAELWTELRGFPYAGLLGQEGDKPRMEPADQLFERLSFFSDVDPGFFDVLLSRVL